MHQALKVIGLFAALLSLMPIVFYTLVSTLGPLCALRVDRTSWVARTKVAWLRALFDRFVV